MTHRDDYTLTSLRLSPPYGARKDGEGSPGSAEP
jgi:hypothetical protein